MQNEYTLDNYIHFGKIHFDSKKLGDGGNFLGDGGNLLGDCGNVLGDGGDLLGHGGDLLGDGDIWWGKGVTYLPTDRPTYLATYI